MNFRKTKLINILKKRPVRAFFNGTIKVRGDVCAKGEDIHKKKDNKKRHKVMPYAYHIRFLFITSYILL